LSKPGIFKKSHENNSLSKGLQKVHNSSGAVAVKGIDGNNATRQQGNDSVKFYRFDTIVAFSKNRYFFSITRLGQNSFLKVNKIGF
jgi:hypothetical protein